MRTLIDLRSRYTFADGSVRVWQTENNGAIEALFRRFPGRATRLTLFDVEGDLKEVEPLDVDNPWIGSDNDESDWALDQGHELEYRYNNDDWEPGAGHYASGFASELFRDYLAIGLVEVTVETRDGGWAFRPAAFKPEAALVSPHGFDGSGPVPARVIDAGRHIARLRVKFLTRGDISTGDVEDLFSAAAVQAEWMRELYEAIHTYSPVKDSKNAGIMDSPYPCRKNGPTSSCTTGKKNNDHQS